MGELNKDCAKGLHYLFVEREVKLNHGSMMHYNCKNCPHKENKFIEKKESFKVISRC